MFVFAHASSLIGFEKNIQFFARNFGLSKTFHRSNVQSCRVALRNSNNTDRTQCCNAEEKNPSFLSGILNYLFIIIFLLGPTFHLYYLSIRVVHIAHRTCIHTPLVTNFIFYFDQFNYKRTCYLH